MKRVFSSCLAAFVLVSSFELGVFYDRGLAQEPEKEQEIYFKLDFEDSYFGAYDPFDNCDVLPDGNSITVDSDGSNSYMLFEKYAPDYNYPDGVGGNANFRKIINRLEIGQEDKITFQFDIMPISCIDGKGSFYVAVCEDRASASYLSVEGKSINGKSVLNESIWKTVTAYYDFSGEKNYLTVYVDGEELYKTEVSINKVWQIYIQAEKPHPASKYKFDNFYLYNGSPVFDVAERNKLNYASAITADQVSISDDIAAISKYGDYLISGKREKDTLLAFEKDNELFVSVAKLSEILGLAKYDAEYLKWDEAFSLFGIDGRYDNRGFVYWSISKENLSLSQEEIWHIYNSLVFDRPDSDLLASDVKMSHPRLNLTDGSIEKIRNSIKNNEYAKSYYEGSMSFVEEAYVAEPLDNKSDDRTIMVKARDLLDRVNSLAMYYLISEDANEKEEYKSRLWRQLEAVIDNDNFPHWQPDSGLDNCEMAAAVAYAYDWLYYDWSEEQRHMLEEAIVNKALKYADMHYGAQINSDHSWWINCLNSNHNAVDNGGYILASLAVIDKYPDLAGRVLERAIRSLESFQNSFYPDGGWKEGVTYWVYSMKYWAPAVCSLINCYGTDFGLSHSPGIESSPEFIIEACGLGANDFHDSGGEQVVYQISSLYTLSNIFNRPDYADIKLTFDRYCPSRTSLATLINFPETAKVLNDIPLGKDAKFDRIGLVSMRENWLKNDSMFVSFHGGDAFPNHGHYDTGTFVYEYGGVRFAVDLPADSYSFKDRSQVYRFRAEGHNCLVINPDVSSGHIQTAFSPVTQFESSKYGAYAILDMTSAYAPHAQSVKRGIKTEDNRNSVIIRDEIENLSNDSEIYWFMHITADTEVSINSDSAVLTKNGVSIKLELNTNLVEEILCVSSAEPMKTSPNPHGQLDNSAYKKIVVKGAAQKGQAAYIQIKLSPQSHDIVPMTTLPFKQWENPELCQIQYEFENGKKLAKIEIAEENKFAFVAVYNDGELTKLIPAVNNTYDGMSLSSEVEFGEDISTYVYIWETKEGMKPLTKKIPIK